MAPVVASLALACMLIGANLSDFSDIFGSLFSVAFLVFVFGAAPAAFVAMLIYFVLRGRVRAAGLLCSVLGAVIGLTPLLVWGKDEFVHGMAIMPMIAGAIGGFAFWMVARQELNPPDASS